MKAPLNMNIFSLTESALAEVTRLVLTSACHSPVLVLYEQADPQGLFDDIDSAIENRSPIPDVSGRLEKIGGQLKSFMMIGVREQADFESGDLYEVGGHTFVVGPMLRKLLVGCLLVHEDGRFFLKGHDGISHTLLSLAKSRNSGNFLDES